MRRPGETCKDCYHCDTHDGGYICRVNSPMGFDRGESGWPPIEADNDWCGNLYSTADAAEDWRQHDEYEAEQKAKISSPHAPQAPEGQ